MKLKWLSCQGDLRGGKTTARGQKSARQDIFKCPWKFFENQICKIILRICQQMIEELTIKGNILLAKIFLTNFCARQAFWSHFSARYTKSAATPAL